jgi:MFS family permease
MAMGLVLSMSRLGDFLAIATSARIASLFGDFRWALWFGTILCGVSLLATVIYGVLDKAAEKHFNRVVDPSENDFNFKAIFHFDLRFWLVSFLCMTYYSGVLPFVSVSSDFMTSKYHYSETKAGEISSIVTLASMILSPFLGKLLDMVGRRPLFVILGSFVIIPAHLSLAFTNIPPIYPIIAIGLSFSLVPSALWPSVPMIVNEKELGTAFGLMSAIQNAGLGGVNALVGWIIDAHGYRAAMLFFAAMDALGFLFGICLIIVDRVKGGTLSGVAGKNPDLSVN